MIASYRDAHQAYLQAKCYISRRHLALVEWPHEWWPAARFDPDSVTHNTSALFMVPGWLEKSFHQVVMCWFALLRCEQCDGTLFKHTWFDPDDRPKFRRRAVTEYAVPGRPKSGLSWAEKGIGILQLLGRRSRIGAEFSCTQTVSSTCSTSMTSPYLS